MNYLKGCVFLSISFFTGLWFFAYCETILPRWTGFPFIVTALLVEMGLLVGAVICGVCFFDSLDSK